MFFRASSRQRKELQKALAAMKKNDKVVTSGGILGVVVALKDNEDEVTLKVDETSNTRIRVLKSSVVRIIVGRPDRRRSEIPVMPLAAYALTHTRPGMPGGPTRVERCDALSDQDDHLPDPDSPRDLPGRRGRTSRTRSDSAGSSWASTCRGGTILVYEVDQELSGQSRGADPLGRPGQGRHRPGGVAQAADRPGRPVRHYRPAARREPGRDHPAVRRGQVGRRRRSARAKSRRSRALIREVGSLEFRILANDDDDADGLDAVREYFEARHGKPGPGRGQGPGRPPPRPGCPPPFPNRGPTDSPFLSRTRKSATSGSSWASTTAPNAG